MILLVILFSFTLSLTAQELVLDNEQQVILFETESGQTWVVAMDTSERYLVVRHAMDGKVILDFPEDKTASWDAFHYDYYLRGGGAENEGLDLNTLTFEWGSAQYEIYDEYAADSETQSYGIRITDGITETTVDHAAIPGSVEGNLLRLRDFEW